MKIIQITDLHLNELANQAKNPDPYAPPINTDKSFQSVKNAILQKENSVDIILITGDIAQDPTEKAYRRISPMLQELETDSYCLAGNHDNPEKLEKHCNTKNLHTIDHLDKDDWRIIFLNTSKIGHVGGYLSNKQLDKLKVQLKTKLHVLIAMHHPPIAIHSKWMDKLGMQKPDEFLQIINTHSQVKCIIFGHIHQEFDEIHNNIRFLGSPSTCTQFVSKEDKAIISDLPPAYRTITLEANGSINSTTHYIQK